MNRELLEQPFDSKHILQRKGSYGQMLDYIPAHLVIQRLNDSLDGEWSFEVCEYTQLEDEVVVLGKLTAGGVVKQQFGNSKITRAKDTGEIISIGDDIKSAASDALKKSATLLGVGLHLYGELATANDASESTTGKSGMSSMSGNQGDNLITRKQLALIKKLRTELQWSADDLQDKSERLFATRDIASLNSTMGTALIAYLQNQGNGGSKSNGK